MHKSGMMSRFIFDELEKNRKFYNALAREDFNEEIVISDEMIRDFLQFGRSENINVRVYRYKDVLKKYLKATMAAQLYGTDAFEKLINNGDKIIEKVIELSEKKQ